MMSRSTKIAEATHMIIIYYKYLSPAGARIYPSVVNKPFIAGFVCIEFESVPFVLFTKMPTQPNFCIIIATGGTLRSSH